MYCFTVSPFFLVLIYEIFIVTSFYWFSLLWLRPTMLSTYFTVNSFTHSFIQVSSLLFVGYLIPRKVCERICFSFLYLRSSFVVLVCGCIWLILLSFFLLDFSLSYIFPCYWNCYSSFGFLIFLVHFKIIGIHPCSYFFVFSSWLA